MKYTIEILKSAQKELARIDKQDQTRIIDVIKLLESEPRPHGCRKLSGRLAWRIRIGCYRVIYEIHDNKLRVLVVTIRHRRDAY